MQYALPRARFLQYKQSPSSQHYFEPVSVHAGAHKPERAITRACAPSPPQRTSTPIGIPSHAYVKIRHWHTTCVNNNKSSGQQSREPSTRGKKRMFNADIPYSSRPAAAGLKVRSGTQAACFPNPFAVPQSWVITAQVSGARPLPLPRPAAHIGVACGQHLCANPYQNPIRPSHSEINQEDVI